jgi:ABC-type polar amino acid transport system ATPase subunit
MISETTIDKRAEVTVRLMDSLADAVDQKLREDDTDSASKLADSLTLLIIKTHEVEAMGSMADSASKLSRGAGRIARKLDLGDLD